MQKGFLRDIIVSNKRKLFGKYKRFEEGDYMSKITQKHNAFGLRQKILAMALLPMIILVGIAGLSIESVSRQNSGYVIEKELEGMIYHSKLDLKENVRVVVIDGLDACAWSGGCGCLVWLFVRRRFGRPVILGSERKQPYDSKT